MRVRDFFIWTFFNINNDFKTSVVIDFALDFFTDIWEENSVEYLKNREEAKMRLIKLLEIKLNYWFLILLNQLKLIKF